MADGKSTAPAPAPDLSRWGNRKRKLKRFAFSAAALAVTAALIWLFLPGGSDREAAYQDYVATNAPGENRDKTAAEIQAFLSENFPPDEYEFLGIIAQRQPTPQSPSTTTYVLFKRK